MKLEYFIILLEWLIMPILLIKLIPLSKIRIAMVAYMFKQLLTWLLGLIVVELRLLEYPVRLFAYANKTSFTFEYLVYPAICALFNVHYPVKQSRMTQFLYYSAFCTVITVLEVLGEEYTNLITYLHWTWYITWISLFLTFYLSRKFVVWFFQFKDEEI